MGIILVPILTLSIAISVLLILLCIYLVNPNTQNNSNFIFECGVEFSYLIRNPLSLQFFILGLIFVIFDIEIIFLYNFLPNSQINNYYLHFLTLFIIFILLTLLYEWHSNNLNWTF